MEALSPTARTPRLLDQLRATLRVRHMSLNTEEAYVDWARRFLLFHGKRHPKELGAAAGLPFRRALGGPAQWRQPRRRRHESAGQAVIRSE